MLAISLHATRDELRDELVPINRKYPIADLMQACRDYPGLSNARRITFEYVMLKGINDSLADARALVRLVAGIPAKITAGQNCLGPYHKAIRSLSVPQRSTGEMGRCSQRSTRGSARLVDTAGPSAASRRRTASASIVRVRHPATDR